MTSLQIEYFIAVAENLSFSEAAKKKYISQPSISKHIRHLETELNATLFDRTGRNLKLTHVGELYLNFFKESLQRMEEIKIENKQYLESLLGMVHIAIISSMNASDLISEVLETCADNHPNINIQTSFLPFSEIELALDNGDADLMINLRDFVAKKDDIVLRKLAEMPKAIFYHKDLIIRDDGKLTPAEFRELPFLVLDPAEYPLIEPGVINYCQEYGFTPHIKHVPNIESMIGGVRHKQGVAIFDTLLDIESEKIHSIPLKTPHEIVLVWKKNNNSNPVHIVANELLFLFSQV